MTYVTSKLCELYKLGQNNKPFCMLHLRVSLVY